MSASNQAMINQIQMLLAQPPASPGPSIFGIQGQAPPPDTSALQTLLTKLQQQQQLTTADAPTPGPYGYLHDAGKSAFNSIGQTLGNGLSGALGQGPNAVTPPTAAAPSQGNAPPVTAGATTGDGSAPAPTTPTPLTAQSDVNAAVMQAKQAYAAMLAQGTPPDQAKISTLKMMIQAGVPGADEQLDAAYATSLKNANTASDTTKNTSQSKMDDADTAGKAFTQGTQTWKTTFTDPKGLFEIQTNQAGEQKRVELNPPPSAAVQMAASLDPSSIQFAADTYRTTGKFLGSFARNPAMQAAVLRQVAADATTNGDTAGAIAARTASLKASGTALDQVTKQEAFTTSAFNTLDKNLTALQTIGSQVDSTGSPLVNKVINHFNQGVVSDPTTAAYVAMLNAVQGEYAKIASNSNGNAPITDSAKADAKDVINKAMSQGGIQGVRTAMLQEGGNRLQAIRESKQSLVDQLSGNAPGAPQGASRPAPQTGTTQAGTPAPTNPQGWTLHKDARGNQAYVSPDGKQFQAVSN
jgi:hypothetical protein